VVDFVRARVVQVLAFEVNLRATDLVGEAFGVENRGRTAGELLFELVKLIPERFVFFYFFSSS